MLAFLAADVHIVLIYSFIASKHFVVLESIPQLIISAW